MCLAETVKEALAPRLKADNNKQIIGTKEQPSPLRRIQKREGSKQHHGAGLPFLGWAPSGTAKHDIRKTHVCTWRTQAKTAYCNCSPWLNRHPSASHPIYNSLEKTLPREELVIFNFSASTTIFIDGLVERQRPFDCWVTWMEWTEKVNICSKQTSPMSQVCFHLISSNNFAGINSLHVLKIHVLQYFILKCTSGQKSTDHSTSYIGWENFDSSDLESVTTTTSEQPRSWPVFLHTKKRGYLATSLAGHKSSHQVSMPLFL